MDQAPYKRQPWVDERKEREIALVELADRQHRVVASWQLRELGFSRQVVAKRVTERRWHRHRSGCIVVGPRTLTPRGHLMAAVLAAGPKAAASHRAAAELHGISRSSAVEVTAPTQRRRKAGATLHHAALPPDEVTVVDGIPVTTVARTILDLASVVSEDRVEQALREAVVQRLGDETGLDALLARYPRRQGTSAVRRILADPRFDAGVTKEEFERLFRLYVEETGFPSPRYNHWVEGYLCDVVWADARLIVELDSRSFHDNPWSFDSDRLRDRKLDLLHWRPVRVTWRQFQQDRAGLTADLWEYIHRARERGSRVATS